MVNTRRRKRELTETKRLSNVRKKPLVRMHSLKEILTVLPKKPREKRKDSLKLMKKFRRNLMIFRVNVRLLKMRWRKLPMNVQKQSMRRS